MKNHAGSLPHPKYRPDIDGLRAIAVIAVVAFHGFPELFKGGFIGVDIFFVISGFLISKIIFESLNSGTFSFKEFYFRRIRRIFPALLVVSTTCFAFGWMFLLASELNQLGKHIAAGAGFLSNIVLWKEVGYFDNSAETKPLLHLWSLGVEEQFYIFWPLLLFLSWKSRLNLLIITIIATVASFTLNTTTINNHPVGNFYLPIARFWEILIGSTLAWFSTSSKSSNSSHEGKSPESQAPKPADLKTTALQSAGRNLLAFGGLLLLVFGFIWMDKKLVFPGFWAIVPVLGTVLIISAGSDAWINRVILSNSVFVWFGLISFPLYLWHWPILSFQRIIFGTTAPPSFRLAAVLASIPLAWITTKFIEKPFRFGNTNVRLKISILISLAVLVGLGGLFVSIQDFRKTHTVKRLANRRLGMEHGLGSSLDWFQGKGDWLFPGNQLNDTVAKLKLTTTPTEENLKLSEQLYNKAAETCFKRGVVCTFILGPDKHSIYPEYLPDELVPSPVKYSSFFVERLKKIPNLKFYDPTFDLIRAKEKEGLFYYMTDTHWNEKGAFLAFSGSLKLLGFPQPVVDFRNGIPRGGDLIRISGLQNFPLHPEDNWNVIWSNNPTWTEVEITKFEDPAFGKPTLVFNSNPIVNKYIWVIGDSFVANLRQYFNATFKEIRYVGHWAKMVEELPEELAKAERLPDIVFIVAVERSF